MNDPAAQRRYLDGEYRKANPTWDQEDSPWKASLVRELIVEAGIPAASIAEIGCGAGGVLAELRRAFPQARLSGFDISPDAAAGVEYTLGDFFQLAGGLRYDVILVLDVLEHLADPMEFLARLRPRAGHFILHIPLDLSAFSVLRETPLLYVRRKVGHIHYYTRSLALALLEECGYEVREARYTGAAFNAPQRTWKTRVASLARRAVYALGKDLGVRLLGGETLLVLARARP